MGHIHRAFFTNEYNYISFQQKIFTEKNTQYENYYFFLYKTHFELK